MLDVVYFNYFTVGSLIALIFYMLMGLFLLLAIPGRSRATFHLGVGFIYSAFLALPYLPSAAIYHPLAAFHRWMTVPAAMLIFIHWSQFFFHYPGTMAPRTSRIILIVQYMVSLGVAAFFCFKTYSADKVYFFSGHFWDFDSARLSIMVAAVILTNQFTTLIVGVARTVHTKTSERWIALAIALFMFFATFPPGITNVLSRDGLIPREIHQTFLLVNTIIGYFIVALLFINNTRDRSSFMVKIVGISLVTFLVVLATISVITFQDKETAYDSIHREQTGRMVKDAAYRVEDLRYLVSFRAGPGDFAYEFRAGAAAPRMAVLKDEFRNTILYEKVAAVPPERYPEGVKAVLSGAPVFARGYRDVIQARLAKLVPDKAESRRELLKYMQSLGRPVLYRFNKIRKLPDEGFRAGLKKILPEFKGELAPFRDAIESRLDAAPGSKGKELKREVLRFLRPMYPAGERHYRIDSKNGGTHYTAFMHYEKTTGVIYEAGFEYRTYRAYVHTLGMRMTLITVVVILIVVVGFRFFFLGTLVNPLNSLIRGVGKVNDGDLSVNVPVRVEDEIGYLSQSFNNMVQSIKSAKLSLEKYADELEDKVRERTSELRNTLETVQQLKHQQDGDYFLTSLIIKPLATNKVRSETVHVDFLMEQKKKFEFRKWKEEIGGDICSAHGIHLKNRPYTVFLNADAMGKSMQGAGGALVLGAVFESMIERTQLMGDVRNQFPERWMKNSFIELQKIFESFDGSMLVSLVLGLVDDTTGIVYYINAEHPWTVLYREGRAVFIEKELKFRKLGTSGIDGKLSISTIQLQPGDVLIAGSDGRDDLLKGLDEDGKRIINEDENLFLRIVEGAQGDLNRIRSSLDEIGELTDDLSLIRVAYRESADMGSGAAHGDSIAGMLDKARKLSDAEDLEQAEQTLKQALAKDTHDPRIIKSLVRLYMKKKDYENAASFTEDYIYLRPMDTEMIYLASYLSKKRKEFEQAADLGERVRLRIPGMARNLLNLAEIYASLGNHRRAEKLLREILEGEPDNERARKILSVVEKRLAAPTPEEGA